MTKKAVTLAISIFIVIFSAVWLVVSIGNLNNANIEYEKAKIEAEQSQAEADQALAELNESVDNILALCKTGEITGC